MITRHRRWWASQYLETCLRAQWEQELKAAARQFHLMAEEKGKPPTLKQFAKHAIEPARSWFGGDVGLLYGSIGQKLAREGVRRNILMPTDRVGFVQRVFTALGGLPYEHHTVVEDRAVAQRQAADRDRHMAIRRLAAESLSYVQAMEALERAPTLKEIGSRFEWSSKVLSDNPEVAWVAFSRTVEQVLAASSDRPPRG